MSIASIASVAVFSDFSRLSFRRALGLAALAIGWIWLTGLSLSYLPRITWVGNHISTQASPYASTSFPDRAVTIFQKWDSNHYLRIAGSGYEKNLDLAFFPGWPFLLGGLSHLFGLHSAGTRALLASLLNLFFLAGALWVWCRVLGYSSLREKARNRWLWLVLFYPTSVFFACAYPELLFIFLGGLTLWAILDARPLAAATSLALFVTSKHVAIACGLAILVWVGFRRRQTAFPLLCGFAVGVGAIFLLNYLVAGDILCWIKAQAGWGRHLGWPSALIADLHGKGAELALYVPVLLLAPFFLLGSYWSHRKAAEGEVTLLLLFYTLAIYLPVIFGSSVESIYRVVFLATPVVALVGMRWVPQRRPAEIAFWALVLILNLHATYRLVNFLYLT